MEYLRTHLKDWESSIRKFYERNLPFLPDNCQHRYFKLVWKYPLQRAVHIRDSIKSPEHLQRLLIKYAPQHVYYSLTTWLDPTTVRGRKSPAVPLWSDLVFDIDADRLQPAKEIAMRLISYLQSMGYKKFRVLFTGNKGFHIYVDDFKYDKYPEDYRERLRYFERKKRSIIDELLSAGIDIDPTLWDAYRVVRLPNTLNATTMLRAEWVPLEKLASFRPTIIRKYPDRPSKIYSHTILVSSHVIGTPDRHVLFLDYDGIDYRDVRQEVVDIIDRYNLSTAYVFRTTKGYNVWFLDALPLRRILRIKSNTSEDPMHYEHIKLYGYDLVRIWYKVFDDGRVHSKPYLFDVIPSNNTKYPLSRGHADLLRARYFQEVAGNSFTGLPTVKIIYASAKVAYHN